MYSNMKPGAVFISGKANAIICCRDAVKGYYVRKYTQVLNATQDLRDINFSDYNVKSLSYICSLYSDYNSFIVGFKC